MKRKVKDLFKKGARYEVSGPNASDPAKPLRRRLKYLGMARLVGGPHILFFSPTRGTGRRSRKLL